MESDLAKVDAYVNTAADYAEIPEVTDEEFSKATLEVGGRPIARGRGRPALGAAPKALVSLRIDQDVIAHFKGGGPGWQSRINAALRLAMGKTAVVPKR